MTYTDYTLVSGVELHEAKPDRFFVPSDEVKKNIVPGDRVRLIFHHEDIETPDEHLWLLVDEAEYPNYRGRLGDWSLFKPDLAFGQVIDFHADNIVFVKKTG